MDLIPCFRQPVILPAEVRIVEMDVPVNSSGSCPEKRLNQDGQLSCYVNVAQTVLSWIPPQAILDSEELGTSLIP